jgi:hypothetical protein
MVFYGISVVFYGLQQQQHGFLWFTHETPPDDRGETPPVPATQPPTGQPGVANVVNNL